MSAVTARSERRMHVTSHFGLAGLESLENAWRTLTGSDRRYWIQYDFFRELVRHGMHGSKHLVFLAVHDDDNDTIGIVPLIETVERIRRIPFRCVELFGSTQDLVSSAASVADFPAEAGESEVVFREVIQALRVRRPRPSLFLAGRTADGGSTLSAIGSFRYGEWSYPINEAGHFLINTKRPYTDLMNAVGNKFRANLNRRRKNLNAFGVTEQTVCTPRDPGFREAYREFLSLESSGWKRIERSGISVHPNGVYRRFFDALAACSGPGYMEVHRITLNGSTIAAALYWFSGHSRAALKTGYNEEFARFGLGHMIIEHALRMSCEDPCIDEVDLVSDSDWQTPWDVRQELYRNFYVPILPGWSATLASLLLKMPTLEAIKSKLHVRSRTEIPRDPTDRTSG